MQACQPACRASPVDEIFFIWRNSSPLTEAEIGHMSEFRQEPFVKISGA